MEQLGIWAWFLNNHPSGSGALGYLSAILLTWCQNLIKLSASESSSGWKFGHGDHHEATAELLLNLPTPEKAPFPDLSPSAPALPALCFGPSAAWFLLAEPERSRAFLHQLRKQTQSGTLRLSGHCRELGQEHWCLAPASASLSVCISFAPSPVPAPKCLLTFHRNWYHLP